MKRVFNFSPGPAMLPTPVLERAQSELLDWRGSGMSVMEVSHRGSDFIELAAQSERDLRALLGVPANYKVLFLQGGATLQFAAVPLNLAPAGAVADYVVTGNWGEKAVSEAERYVRVNVAANSKATKFTTVPEPKTWRVSDSAVYLHYTPNETVFGVEFHSIPEVSDAPLVADMSSTLLSRPLDVSRFGLIYAGAQKNIGPAGLAIVIVREDLLGRARRETPGVIDYKTMAENDSMWNTPSTLSWYFAALVFDWLEEQGGLEAMGRINERKAAKLYGAIDASGPADLSIPNGMAPDEDGILRDFLGAPRFQLSPLRIAEASTTSYARKDASVLILHGTADTFVSIDHAEHLFWTSRWIAEFSFLIFLIAAMGLPLLFLLTGSFNLAAPGKPAVYGLDNWIRAFTDPDTLGALWMSFLLSVVRLIPAMILSVMFAWLIARTDMPGGRWLESVCWVAYFVPDFPLVLAWILLLDPNFGFLNALAKNLPFVEGALPDDRPHRARQAGIQGKGWRGADSRLSERGCPQESPLGRGRDRPHRLLR